MIQAKQNLYTSIVPRAASLPDRRPPSLLDVLTPTASAATIVTKTIGTAGRDYTTIAAWEVGQEGDLVADDKIHAEN